MKENYFTTKFLLVAAFMLIGAIGLQAQGIEDDVPPNPEFGKCYAKCRMADQYETVTEKVKTKEEGTKTINIPAVYGTEEQRIMTKEASTQLISVPAEYGTEEERIMIKPASTQIITIPAEYKTEDETVMVKPASTTRVEVPAVYSTNVEKILVSPESGKWITKRVDSECFSKNPEDCLVKCYVKVPARYNYVEKKVLVTPATVQESPVPAEYKTVTKRVLAKPATTKEVPIPAEYSTITKTVLKKPATTKEMPIPAEYTTVTKTVLKQAASTKTEPIAAEYKEITSRKLVSKGGYSSWEEILCSADMNLTKIQQVQSALKRAGYDPGPVDGVMGSKTKVAMEKYQRENGLPVGNMNLKTLEHMGIEY